MITHTYTGSGPWVTVTVRRGGCIVYRCPTPRPDPRHRSASIVATFFHQGRKVRLASWIPVPRYLRLP